MSLKSELEGLEHLADNSYQDSMHLLVEIKGLAEREPDLDLSYILDLAKSTHDKSNEIYRRILL